MFEIHTPLQAAGQFLLGMAFLATGVRNVLWKFRMHAERMTALGVPAANAVLVAGFIIQFAGAVLLLADLQRVWGAALLIAFTVLASAIFHRWWRIPDPLVRHLHVSALLLNIGLVGALLLVAAL